MIISNLFLVVVAFVQVCFSANLPLTANDRPMGFKQMYFNVTPLARSDLLDLEQLPKEFDVRTKWPECSDIISEISSQNGCGSCWAMAASATISDRICIASKGKVKVRISAQDLLECCGVGPGLCADGIGDKGGCEGGDQFGAFKWFKEHGLVSGSNYGKVGCKPYDPDRVTKPPTCVEQCENSQYPISYSKDHHFGQEYYKVAKTELAIMNELYQHGTVAASVTAGVWNTEGPIIICPKKPNSTHLESDHAIRLIGWGEQNGAKYWLGANSWGTWFKDRGFFKIRRGTNECNVEEDVSALIPAL